jgi:hypothetical protein
MRPIYETKDDRVRERFVAEAVAAHWRVDLERETRLAVNDYKLTTNGKPFALMEVKCRVGYDWTTLRFMYTYMLSLKKWNDLWKLCRENDWALCLAIADMNAEVWAAKWRGTPPDYDVRNGGRRDRNDDADIEKCVFIPTDEFDILIRDRDPELTKKNLWRNKSEAR